MSFCTAVFFKCGASCGQLFARRESVGSAPLPEDAAIAHSSGRFICLVLDVYRRYSRFSSARML